MAAEHGIIMDLFPPLTWDEEGIRLALEIQEAADMQEEGVRTFTTAEIDFLARSIAYYMALEPNKRSEKFTLGGQDPDVIDVFEDGRYVINMAYPPHLEPPASLR